MTFVVLEIEALDIPVLAVFVHQITLSGNDVSGSGKAPPPPNKRTKGIVPEHNVSKCNGMTFEEPG